MKTISPVRPMKATGGISAPKIHVGGMKNIGGIRKPNTGDELKMAKRFFLYRNIFGNMGGAPANLAPGGGMTPSKGGIASGINKNPLGLRGSTGSPGGIAGFDTARRMGMI